LRREKNIIEAIAEGVIKNQTLKRLWKTSQKRAPQAKAHQQNTGYEALALWKPMQNGAQ
jgi:hypothetical protein